MPLKLYEKNVNNKIFSIKSIVAVAAVKVGLENRQ